MRKKIRFVSTSGGSRRSPGVSAMAWAISLGVAMVVGQALDVVVQGVQGGRGKDAGLAHAAAEQLADAAGPG